jgi:hypothetical protein
MTAHRGGSACTRAVVRKPAVKERAGEEVPTVPRALWRFDRGVEGGLKTRERGCEEMAGGGGSRARLSRDDGVFSGKIALLKALPGNCSVERRRGQIVTSGKRD